MISRAAQIWWGFLAIVVCLAIWLTGTGYSMLHGLPLELLEALARGRELLLVPGPAPWPVDGSALIGKLPGDPLGWASFLTAALNAAAALLLLAVTYWSWRNPIGPVLAVGAAFFGAETMWVESLTPQQSLLHLLLACALAALIAGAVPLLTGAVLAVAMLEPGHGVALYLALVYLSYRRQAAYGLLVPTLALVGVGCLLVPLAGEYRLQPSFSGWQLWSLLPALVAIIPSGVRSARGGIYASLLLGAWLTGTPELATVLAAGDLVFVALRSCATQPERQPTNEDPPRASEEDAPGPSKPNSSDPKDTGVRQLPLRAVVGLLATLALWNLALPGERFLNSRVLIPAQKAKVPLPQLFLPLSLQQHAKQYVAQPWRAAVPFPSLGASDYELALELAPKELPNGFCLVTVGAPEERQNALLYALLSGQKLGGWDDPEHLAAPLLLCRRSGKNLLHQGPAVIVREGDSARLTEPLPIPAKLAPLDLRSVLSLPHRLQHLSREPGTAYRWSSSGQDYTVVFPDDKAELMLSSRPGEYRLASLQDGGAQRRVEVFPAGWELSGLPNEVNLPSRSLIELELTLTNRGEGPIGSEMIAGWRIETSHGASLSPFLQENPKPFILYPGESTGLLLYLATPEPEGVYQARARVLTPEARLFEVPFSGSTELRTWRRMPPVGTWVEEP